MRVHAFLEQWGLINFAVDPQLKPHKFSLLKEGAYTKVLVNAANKHYLAKSEGEYLGNLFEEERDEAQGYIRKLNMVTARLRPFCAFCNAIVGFTWYLKKEGDQYALCTTCFKQGNYPTGLDPKDFTEHAIPEEVWDTLHKDLNIELEHSALSRPSTLSADRQAALLEAVAKHGHDWKAVADAAGLKSKREAIVEFMRAPETFPSHPAPVDAPSNPYSQADLLFLQCELLQTFANTPDTPSDPTKKRDAQRLSREKRKLGHKLLVSELSLLEEELKELRTVDSFVSKARIDLKNLGSQMFAERFSLVMTNKTRQ